MSTVPASLATARDVPLLIVSAASSSERRITPSWTISILKAKLEPVTGIPPFAQRLKLRLPEQQEVHAIEATNEDVVQVGQWSLVPYAEIQVTSANPDAGIILPASDSIAKQEMAKETYEQLPDTVLDYKKRHKIGRFDPMASAKQDQKVKSMWEEVQQSKLQAGARCRLSNEDTRRGTVRFVGVVDSLPGLPDAPWIGIALDEPYGKNDGVINGQRLFQCRPSHGVLVRPDRVEAGDYPELGLEEDDPDMEEI